ncbi:hypothetical protein NP233_g128 [Leucocoprinus birnbaumii]|uniref:C3H1-type domain-containing protein n=1 Tax=Leucocoprinus birnbaumii TaxID=56174 RepID=A0AAD5W5Y5_9AGAR|nr:hypothetical protein NP233_g128 [Leucocoprinus birnbaumii]
MDGGGRRHSFLDVLQHVMPVTGIRRFSWAGWGSCPCPVMSLPDPIWRVRTQPCPFYRQGRCIFADSCNFLHTAPSQSSQKSTLSEERADDRSTSVLSAPAKPPLISVESPRSMRSPPRSPRMESLLLALKDVLSEEQEDDSNTLPVDQDATSALTNASWSASSTTFVDESTPVSAKAQEKFSPSASLRSITPSDTNEPFLDDHLSFVHDSQTHEDLDSDAGRTASQHPDTHSQNDTSTANAYDPSTQPLINTIDSSPVVQKQDHDADPVHLAARDDLLSPVELSHLQLANFARASMDMTEFIDDDIDTWRPPLPLAISPPRSPAVTSTFELLASPFGSPVARVLSPRISAFIGRHSIASGGDPEAQSPHDSDLDSPQTRPIPTSANVSPAPPPSADVMFDHVAARSDEHELDEKDSGNQPADQILLRAGEDDVERDDVRQAEAAAEGTSREKAKSNILSPSVPQLSPDPKGTELSILNDTSLRQAASPIINRFSRTRTSSGTSYAQVEFSEPMGANSSDILNTQQLEDTRGIADSVESANQHHPPRQEPLPPPLDYQGTTTILTSPFHENSSLPPVKSGSLEPQIPVELENARLASLGSPEGKPVDGGSFASLYEAYSDFSSSPQELASSISAQDRRSTDITAGETSSISTPASFTREQVFTPPSPELRNHTMRGDSPHSDIPLRSQHSISASSRTDGLSAPTSPQDDSSKKIAFGWRSSRVSSRSSKTSRTSRTPRTIPRLPLDFHRSPPPANEPPSLSSSPSSPLPPTHPSSRLRPLRLSVVLNSQSQSQQSRSAPPHVPTSQHRHQQSWSRHESMSISHVSSNHRTSHNHSLSSRFSSLSDRMRNNLIASDSRIPSPLTSDNFAQLSNFGPPQSAPLPYSHIWRRASIHSIVSQDEYSRASSRLSDRNIRPIDEEDDNYDDDETESREYHPEYEEAHSTGHIYQQFSPPPIPPPPHSAPVTQPVDRPFYHAVSTAKPTLMFAIASDDVAEVRRVLESGDAGPNDTVGPQTALEFALTNEHLQNKMEIVKTLLAYGADPRVVKQPNATVAQQRRDSVRLGGQAPEVTEDPGATSLMDDIDPAIRYYVERADAPHTRRTSALIHRSFFRPLTRVRYELVGQDCVLEQLFKVLSIQSRGFSTAPIVVLLCGPSGHGKSLLARKFGYLLDVPTHTVNMTTLKSTHDLWQSHSMSPYETPTTCTLAEFLINNEGKRCVVVLDEIEKTDEKTLWSLLMPWELGRCLFEAGSRQIDVRNVVWLGTSNIGHDLVFKHHESRARPDELMGREEYVELMSLLRPLVSERLGASVLSRVTTVLPFVPFTLEERKAICSEALNLLGGEDVRTLSLQTVESVIQGALASYCAAEGARSLYRAISNQLMDII